MNYSLRIGHQAELEMIANNWSYSPKVNLQSIIGVTTDGPSHLPVTSLGMG